MRARFTIAACVAVSALAGNALPAQQAAVSTHWSFRLPAAAPAPRPVEPGYGSWAANPVDAFIFARLRKEGLLPSPPADRRTLLRRVTFDLTGIPPSPEALQVFLTDRAPGAYERVVKRLLASPAFGERWGQHWLDVVRFAETNGYELDGDRPQAWRYRDYVVRALNADTPYDRFLTEQIAGDELDPSSFEMRVATGFLRAGPQHVVGGNQDLAVNRQEWLTEATAGIGNGILGLTVNCARCHDHKFDPIPQADYYRLQAFFAASDSSDFTNASAEEKQKHKAVLDAHSARLKPLRDQVAAIEAPYRTRLREAKRAKLAPEYLAALAVEASKRTPEQKTLASIAGVMQNLSWDEVVEALSPEDRARRAGLRRQMHAIDLEAPEPLPMAPAVTDVRLPVPATHVLVRGEPHVKGAEVQPAFLSATGQAEPATEALASGSTGRRLSLAKWLARPDHPLTGRVMVNRAWQRTFGRGLVATSNDFGRYGELPSHPELLDYLARRFTGRSDNGLGWSLKRLVFLLVTSQTYRQAGPTTRPPALAVKRDPENRLLWRANRKRLDAEAIRDAVLAANGTLNQQMGGPSIRVPIEPEIYETIFTEGEPDNLWPVHPDPKQHARRSLYLLRKRNVRLPMLAVFDQPDMMHSCAARGQSVHVLQALTLLNSDFMRDQSRELAARVRRDAASEAARVNRLFELTLGRSPTKAERDLTHRFMRDGATQDKVWTDEAWTDLCLAVLNLNDFVYVR